MIPEGFSILKDSRILIVAGVLSSPDLILHPAFQKSIRSLQSPALSGRQMDFILPKAAALLNWDFWAALDFLPALVIPEPQSAAASLIICKLK